MLAVDGEGSDGAEEPGTGGAGTLVKDEVTRDSGPGKGSCVGAVEGAPSVLVGGVDFCFLCGGDELPPESGIDAIVRADIDNGLVRRAC